jgi:hypothetical protein
VGLKESTLGDKVRQKNITGKMERKRKRQKSGFGKKPTFSTLAFN